MSKKPALEDLTKPELVELMRSRLWRPSEREVAGIIWKRMTDCSQAKREQALASVHEALKRGDHAGFLRATRDFDRAMALEDRASEYFRLWVVPNNQS